MLTYLKDEEPTLNKAIFLLVANKIDAVITRVFKLLSTLTEKRL
jgi:hypothetical protein